MTRKLKNRDIIWEELFKNYNLQEKINTNGYTTLTSEEINNLKENVQARIIAKFDKSSQLPPILSDQGLGVLPIANGVYHIGKFNIFHKFEVVLDNIEVEYLNIENQYQTVTHFGEKSEANALHAARIAGVFDKFFDSPVQLTQSGRMRVLNGFKFEIDGITLNVDNTQQIEIDALLETENDIVVIEGKNGAPSDFNIRQLYYPKRVIEERFKPTKEVSTLYYLYTADTHYLLKYRFEDNFKYNSIIFERAKAYRINDDRIQKDTLLQLLESTEVIEENPNHTFPQANSIVRLIDLIEKIGEYEKNYDDEEQEIIDYTYQSISDYYSIEERQGRYYADTATYLGFLDYTTIKRIRYFHLTERGKKFINANSTGKLIIMLESWFEHAPIRNIVRECIRTNGEVARIKAAEIVQDSGALNISGETLRRRGEGIVSWYNNWLKKFII